MLTKHVHYGYDVFDHLIATEADTTGSGQYDSVQHYVLDVSPEKPSAGVPGRASAQPVLVFDGNENLIERNLVALNPAALAAVMAQEDLAQGGVVTWMADDRLGSPVDINDNSGNQANHMVYASFGEDVYESDTAVAHWSGFAGGHMDANTGEVNYYHRWLTTSDGTWLSQDPAGFGGGDSNLSRYVHNRAASAVDPSGLWKADLIMTGGGYSASDGTIGDYWSIASSDGYYASGLNTTPGQGVGKSSGPAYVSATYNQWTAHITGQKRPSKASPTSVYSLMLDNDPTLAAKIHAAQGQAQMLASASIVFTASAPMIMFALPGGSFAAQGPKAMNWSPAKNPLPWVVGAGIAQQLQWALSQQNHGEDGPDDGPDLLPFLPPPPAIPVDPLDGLPQVTPLAPNKWLIDGQIVDTTPPVLPGDLKMFDPDGDLIDDPFEDMPEPPPPSLD